MYAFGRPTTAMWGRISAARQHLRIPTLLVRGAFSDVVSQDSIRDFKRLLPSAAVIEVAKAAHMVTGDANARPTGSTDQGRSDRLNAAVRWCQP
jgi:pimeloyl-ACP methyl ester carboxylesterase